MGGGLMGQGIAQVAATNGFATTLIKASGRSPEGTRKSVEASVAKAVARGKLSEEAAAQALSRLEVTGDRGAIATADIVIEAIIEDLDAMKELFLESA